MSIQELLSQNFRATHRHPLRGSFKSFRKVSGFKHLNSLKEAVQKEIKKKKNENHSLNGGTPIQRISTKN